MSAVRACSTLSLPKSSGYLAKRAVDDKPSEGG